MFITVEAVKTLKALKANKSSGPDGHHPLVLKEHAAELAETLAIVFQQLLDEGSLLQSWKDAHMTAILKMGKKSTPENDHSVMGPSHHND